MKRSLPLTAAVQIILLVIILNRAAQTQSPTMTTSTRPAVRDERSKAPAKEPPLPTNPMYWTFERIDAPKMFTEMTDRSLVIDGTGHPHIAYGGDHLYYAWHDSSSWQIERVDGSANVGRHASLTLDQIGHPHISYADADNRTLKYARFDGTGWQIETVDNAGEVGGHTSLVLDDTSRPHISYCLYDTPYGCGSLAYAHYDGSAWQVEVLDNDIDAGGFSSLALDGAGRPHISYYGYGLRYAYYDGSTWQIETVDNTWGAGWYSSLVLDDAGRPHISYYIGGSNYDLRYAWYDGSSWQIQTVDNSGSVGQHSSLVLGTDGHPRVSYFDATNDALKYAWFDGATWISMTVDVGGTPDAENIGLYTSLVSDAADQPHISYYSHGLLMYGWLDNGSWQIEQVDHGGTVGPYNSLILDSAGRPHVSYYDESRGDLKYAYHDGGQWQVETVDTGGPPGASNLGLHTSLALDSLDRPHISYCSYALRFPYIVCDDLLYAWHDGTAWITTTVDSGDPPGVGRVGRFNSLALDSADRPHIAYYKETSSTVARIKYAWFDGTDWQIETVQTAFGNSAGHTSLVLDAADHPHISYITNSNAALMYAWNNGSGWQIETVDYSINYGGYTSLALDSAGRPHVSYYATAHLKYAYYDGSQWQAEEVDSEQRSGYYTSLALDTDDHPHISYGQYDIWNGFITDLKYAYHDGTGWQIETVDSDGIVGSYTHLALDSADQPRISYYDESYYDLKYAYIDCKPVQEVTISGAAELPVGVDGFYTATAAPITASTPLDFTWDNGTVGPHASYIWPATGTHTVIVTATNPCGQTQDRFTVTVFCQPLQGLTIEGPLTLFTDQVADYRAVPQPITASRPLSFTWDNGSSDQITYYSWTVPGIYTITVDATNLCGQANASFPVTVHCRPVEAADFSWEPRFPTPSQPIVFTASTGTGGAGWFTETVDSPGWVGEYTSLALDAAGRPHVSYYGRGHLGYAYSDGSTWFTQTVDGADRVGWYTSLALDASSHPHISYCAFDTTYDCNYLKYASYDGNQWQIEIVDGDGWEELGYFTSLALDSTGRPHISYFSDHPGRVLKYAYHDGNQWQIETVQTFLNLIEEISLALDSTDRPHISYYDRQGGYIRHTYYDGATWQTETVDSAGNEGSSTSLALDTADHIHLSYFQAAGNYDLKYAHHDGTAWQIETVDSEGSAGWHTSLALDSFDRPHISYLDDLVFDSNLKYAYHDGLVWHTEMIDTFRKVGFYNSLALDQNDLPHISYYDMTNSNLRYAHQEGASFPTPPISFTWFLGDGTFATGEVITHAYDLTGAYTVTLTVTNCLGDGMATARYILMVPSKSIYLPLLLKK